MIEMYRFEIDVEFVKILLWIQTNHKVAIIRIG